MSPALPTRRVVTCLVAVLLLMAAVPATAPVGAAGGSAVADTPSFGSGIEHVYRGGVASVPVSMADGANVTMSVSGEENYSATLVLRDGDGDGRVTVRLNSYDGTYSASDGDSLTIGSVSGGITPLAVGAYELLACSGDSSECDDGSAAAATRMVVGERSTDGLQAWVAPESANLSTLDDLNRARDTGNLTRTSVVAKNDTLVLELRASGLEGAIASQDGANVTARFSSWLDSSGVSLRVIQTAAGPEQMPLLLNLTDSRATTVIPDVQNNSYYLVADTGRVPVTDDYEGTDERHDLRTSDYRANFTLTGASALADGRESVTDDFAIRGREAETETGYSYGQERVRVQSAPNRTIPVKTTLAPGSKVTVVVDGEGDSFRFEETGRVRNASEGFVVAPTFDVSDVAPGTNFTVTAYHRGKSLMGYGRSDPGTVTESSASVELGRASKLDVGVTAELSYGGFVAVRRGSVDGELLGYSRFIAPGESETVLVSFDPNLESNATLVAVAFRDSNGNGVFDPEADQPYTDGEHDHRVASSKTVTFEWGGEATTTDETPTSKTTATTTYVVTEPESPADPASPGIEIPGFGVGAALVALLVGGLLAGVRVARERK